MIIASFLFSFKLKIIPNYHSKCVSISFSERIDSYPIRLVSLPESKRSNPSPLRKSCRKKYVRRPTRYETWNGAIAMVAQMVQNSIFKFREIFIFRYFFIFSEIFRFSQIFTFRDFFILEKFLYSVKFLYSETFLYSVKFLYSGTFLYSETLLYSVKSCMQGNFFKK